MLWMCLPAARSSAWVRMFSILASSRVPYFWASVRAAPGMSVWTWTLKAVVVLADDQAVADAVQVGLEGSRPFTVVCGR